MKNYSGQLWDKLINKLLLFGTTYKSLDHRLLMIKHIVNEAFTLKYSVLWNNDFSYKKHR